MARQRPVLPKKEIRELVVDRAQDWNEMIRMSNLARQERAAQLLETFVHMALGQLEIGDMVKEYEDLTARQIELRRRFTALLGKNETIEGYTQGNRLALLQRIQTETAPGPLMDQVKRVAERHGISMDLVVPIGEVQINELVDRLARAQSVQEMDYILSQTTAQVVARVAMKIQEDNPNARRPNGAV